MTSKAARRTLWVALLVALPVPYWVMEGGWVTTFWLYELAGFTLAVLLTEGGSIVALITGLFVLEAILATAVLYGLARSAIRLVERSGSERARAAGVAVAVGILVVLALMGIYSTPFVADGRSVNLFQLLA